MYKYIVWVIDFSVYKIASYIGDRGADKALHISNLFGSIPGALDGPLSSTISDLLAQNQDLSTKYSRVWPQNQPNKNCFMKNKC